MDDRSLWDPCSGLNLLVTLATKHGKEPLLLCLTSQWTRFTRGFLHFAFEFRGKLPGLLMLLCEPSINSRRGDRNQHVKYMKVFNQCLSAIPPVLHKQLALTGLLFKLSWTLIPHTRRFSIGAYFYVLLSLWSSSWVLAPSLLAFQKNQQRVDGQSNDDNDTLSLSPDHFLQCKCLFAYLLWLCVEAPQRWFKMI